MTPEGQFVEIQIRSVRMDQEAEGGHAAHWKYKERFLSGELVDVDAVWFEEAKNFLYATQETQQEELDIHVDQLYIKPRSN